MPLTNLEKEKLEKAIKTSFEKISLSAGTTDPAKIIENLAKDLANAIANAIKNAT